MLMNERNHHYAVSVVPIVHIETVTSETNDI